MVTAGGSLGLSSAEGGGEEEEAEEEEEELDRNASCICE